MKRDSSPPEAIRVSGPNGAPGLVETSNSTRSVPDGPGLGGGDCGAEARGVELQRSQLGRDRRHRAAPPPRCRCSLKRGGSGSISFARGEQLRVELARSARRRPRSPPAARASASPRAASCVGLDAMLAGKAADVEQPRLGLPPAAPGRTSSPPPLARSGPRLRSPRSARGRAPPAPRRATGDRPRRARSAAPPAEAAPARRPIRRATRRARSAIRRPSGPPASPRAPRRGASPRPPRAPALRSRQKHVRAIRGRARPPPPRVRASSSSASIRVTSLQARSTGRGIELAESVEQRPVALGVEQSAVVVLAVDLDRRAPTSRRSPAGTLAPATKARLPPSLFSVRRTISGSPGSGSIALLGREAPARGGFAEARFPRTRTPPPARP